jgi:hypothetical protein
MAWIFLAESVGLASLCPHGSEPSPIVNLTDTLKASYCPECDQVTLTKPQYGTMCEHCELNTYQESTLFVGAFHAKTLAQLDMELAWRESEADFFLKSQDLQANYDPDSFSWKTSQLSLFGGLTEFSWSSLRWGMMRDGQLCQPRALEPVTAEIDGGYLPTPTASIEGSNCSPGSTNRQMGLSQLARKRLLPTPTARVTPDCNAELRRKSPSLEATVNIIQSPNQQATGNGSLNPQFVEEIMGYPIDWTALDVVVTQWSRSQRKQSL